MKLCNAEDWKNFSVQHATGMLNMMQYCYQSKPLTVIRAFTKFLEQSL